jgi:hypothetical protein
VIRTGAWMDENQWLAKRFDQDLVADVFKGRAQAALRATIDGDAGAVWAVGTQVRAAFLFTIERDKIAGIDLIMNPDHLAELTVKVD